MGMRLRASRALLVVLGAALTTGAVISIWKFKGNASAPPSDPARAVEQTPQPLMLAATTLPAARRAEAPPARSETPKSAPAPAPARTVLAAAIPPTPPTPPAPAPPASLAAARASFDAGDLVRARQQLTTIVASGKASDAELKQARDLAAQVNALLVFSARLFGDDSYQASYAVQSGEVLERIAGKFDVTAEMLCRVNGIPDPRRLAAGRKIKVIKGPLHAVVTKSKFMLDVYLGEPGAGGALVMSFPVGLGKGDSTPTGVWVVEPGKKLKDPPFYPSESARANGEVYRPGKDLKNPLGSRWIPLTGLSGAAQGKESYGIHGTNAPSSIGKQESLGCVRMHNEDVELVYEMLIGGKSKVVVND